MNVCLTNKSKFENNHVKIKQKEEKTMLNITFVTVGSLKEDYLRDAVAEYVKRLSGFCRPRIVELKEVKLSDSPSESEISSALSAHHKGAPLKVRVRRVGRR